MFNSLIFYLIRSVGFFLLRVKTSNWNIFLISTCIGKHSLYCIPFCLLLHSLLLLLFGFLSFVSFFLSHLLFSAFIRRRMVLGFSFFLRHSCFICIMGFAVSSIIFTSLVLIVLPSSSFAGLRSWLCGTCTICQLCPSCEPHLNISPVCECHENLNNCNCNCISHERLQQYHNEWNLQLKANLHNNHAAQMNSNHFKRYLLFWLVSLSLLIISLLFCLIILIFVAPALLKRYTTWKSNTRLHRRQQYMQKHKLVEQSPPSTIELSSLQHRTVTLPASPTFSSSEQPSYNDLVQQLDTHKQLVVRLTQDLQVAKSHCDTAPSAPSSRIK